MRKITLATMLLVLTVINGTVLAQKAKNVPVTSTIEYQDANFAPLSLQTDLTGPYKNGVGSVVSQIQSPIGDWELDMLGSPTRRLYINFNDLVAGSNPNNLPAPSSGYYPARFITGCSGYGYSLLTLTYVGQNATCGLAVETDISGVRYSIRFVTRYYAGTDNVTVTCTSVASGKCNGWRIQSPNGTGKLIAGIYTQTRVHGNTVLTDYGKYRFSFDLSFTNP